MLDVPGPLQLATDFYLLPMVKVQGCFLASCSAWRPISIFLISDQEISRFCCRRVCSTVISR
jgi:hypothetical protein